MKKNLYDYVPFVKHELKGILQYKDDKIDSHTDCSQGAAGTRFFGPGPGPEKNRNFGPGPGRA